MGSTDAARFAGYNADKIAITPSKPTESAPIRQFVNSPEKNGGMGRRSTMPQNPYEISKPAPPLSATTKIVSIKN